MNKKNITNYTDSEIEDLRKKIQNGELMESEEYIAVFNFMNKNNSENISVDTEKEISKNTISHIINGLPEIGGTTGIYKKIASYKKCLAIKK